MIISIDNALREHRSNISMCNAYLMELQDIDRETIEMLCLPSVVISDMPKTVTHKINNPTANVSETYQRDKTILLREILRINAKIEVIENVLKYLNRKQRFVIESKYFENMTWEELTIAYCKQFPLIKEVDGVWTSDTRPYISWNSLAQKCHYTKNKIRKILRPKKNY
jgi:hypothetical protein